MQSELGLRGISRRFIHSNDIIFNNNNNNDNNNININNNDYYYYYYYSTDSNDSNTNNNNNTDNNNYIIMILPFRSFDDRMSKSPPGAGELASVRKTQSHIIIVEINEYIYIYIYITLYYVMMV